MYASVRRNVRHVRGGLAAKPAGIIQTAPGEGAQVDDGKGPMVHETATRKYCRKPLFGMTLGYPRKSVRLLSWRLEEPTDATLAGTRKAVLPELSTVPLLIIDDLGMRKLQPTTTEDRLELITRRYKRAATIQTSNRPVKDWGKLLGDTAAITALLDRLLNHAHVITDGPRSWRPHSTRRPSAMVPGFSVCISGQFAVSNETYDGSGFEDEWLESPGLRVAE